MEFPIRCFTCGSVISTLHKEFKEKSKTEPKGKVLDDLGIKRLCCRTVIISHPDISEKLLMYNKK